MNFSAEHSDLS